MTDTAIAAFVTGVVFLSLLLAIGCFMAFRPKQQPIPPEAMFIFRVILALAAAGFATVLSGFLDIEGRVAGFSLRAAGTLAIFVAVYRINPPELIRRRLPKPKPARKVRVPADRIDQG